MIGLAVGVAGQPVDPLDPAGEHVAGQPRGELRAESATPAFVASAGRLSSIDDRLDKKLDFYRSYLRNSKIFRADATLKYVTLDDLTWDLEPEALQPYAQWYVDRFRGAARQPQGIEENTLSFAAS